MTSARLSTFTLYPAEKPLELLQSELGVDRLVKLSSNECTFGPLPEAASAFAKPIKLHRYPHSGALPLREAIGSAYGVDASQVVVGNGADELIRLCTLAFATEGDKVVFPWPSFQSYVSATLTSGGRPFRVPLTDDRRLDMEAVVAAASEPSSKLLFVANPNNPTGRLCDAEKIRAMVRALEGTVVCVLDEAYAEFADPQPEGAQLIREGHPGLIVLRTFSKIYGLAALRVGYALISPDIGDALDRVRAVYNVNQPAQEAAFASIQARSSLGPRIAEVKRGRSIIEAALQAAGLKTQKSETNFVYAEAPTGVGRHLPKIFLEQGIMVRGLEPFGAVDAIRVTVGSPEDNQAFVSALEKINSSGLLGAAPIQTIAS